MSHSTKKDRQHQCKSDESTNIPMITISTRQSPESGIVKRRKLSSDTTQCIRRIALQASRDLQYEPMQALRTMHSGRMELLLAGILYLAGNPRFEARPVPVLGGFVVPVSAAANETQTLLTPLHPSRQ